MVSNFLKNLFVLSLDSLVVLCHLIVLVNQLHVLVIETIQFSVQLHQSLLQIIGVVRIEFSVFVRHHVLDHLLLLVLASLFRHRRLHRMYAFRHSFNIAQILMVQFFSVIISIDFCIQVTIDNLGVIQLLVNVRLILLTIFLGKHVTLFN